jgi:hypothetical protein
MLRFNTSSSQGVVATSSSSSRTGREPGILLSSYILEKKIFSVIVYGDAWSTTGGLPMEKSALVADMRQARTTWGPDSMMRSSEERSSTSGIAIGVRGGSSSMVVNLGPLLLAWIRTGVGKCSKERSCSGVWTTQLFAVIIEGR